MANSITATSPAARGMVREINIMPVDERRFESEIRRTDSDIANVRKSQEKFEAEVFRRFDKVDEHFEKLEKSVDARFGKVDAQFEKVDARFDKLENKLDNNFKWLVGIFISMFGVALAAFYAFANYTR